MNRRLATHVRSRISALGLIAATALTLGLSARPGPLGTQLAGYNVGDPSGQLSGAQVVELASNAGWSGNDLVTIVAIERRESTWQTGARNPQTCGGAYHAEGLYQLCGHASDACQYDAVCSSTVAYNLWVRSGRNFYGPWMYPPPQSDFVLAQQAVSSVASAPPAAATVHYVGMARTPSGHGYWLVRNDGAVKGFGDAANHGTRYGLSWIPIMGIAAGSGGFWLVDLAGNVFPMGAPNVGYAFHAASFIVGITATPSGRGYWLDGADGAVYSFGDAKFYGPTTHLRLNAAMDGIAGHPGGGYYEVAGDGGIFAWGAPFHGSTGGMHLNKPIVGMAAVPNGTGYWEVASDGGVFSFGGARFHGSTGALHLNAPVVGMTATPDGGGYWMVASDGGIFSFGDAHYYGRP